MLLSSTSHLEKTTLHSTKPILSPTPLKRQKSLTHAWNVEKKVIRKNVVQRQFSQTKYITKGTEGNAISFSGLNDLSTIPSTLKEILESKNKESKSEKNHVSVKGKLK